MKSFHEHNPKCYHKWYKFISYFEFFIQQACFHTADDESVFCLTKASGKIKKKRVPLRNGIKTCLIWLLSVPRNKSVSTPYKKPDLDLNMKSVNFCWSDKVMYCLSILHKNPDYYLLLYYENAGIFDRMYNTKRFASHCHNRRWWIFASWSRPLEKCLSPIDTAPANANFSK